MMELGGYDAGLDLVVELVVVHDVLALEVGKPAVGGVEKGLPRAQVPLLDEGTVDVNVIIAANNLPNLVSGTT